MLKVYRFPHPDGKFLVVTEDPSDSTRSTTHMEDADGNVIPGNISTVIADDFAKQTGDGTYKK